MPIPDDRQLEEYDDEAVESSTLPDMLDDEEVDELEFETADADTSDELLGAEDSSANDEGFGFGDPAD